MIAPSAPFNTVIDSISFGFISFNLFPKSTELFKLSEFWKEELFIGTPSTTIRAWLFPVNDLGPLNTILVELPGVPPVFVILAPVVFPCKPVKAEEAPPWVSSSLLTVTVPYPKLLFSLLTACAVTTTSSSIILSSAMEKSAELVDADNVANLVLKPR